MGIVPSTFNQATCTRLLLWFALLRLMLSMELTDMVDMVLAMPDMDMELTHMPMVDTDTHMPTELTSERDLLMLSQRLRLMLSMELTHMVDMELTHMLLDTLMVVTHMLMVVMDTHMP